MAYLWSIAVISLFLAVQHTAGQSGTTTYNYNCVLPSDVLAFDKVEYGSCSAEAYRQISALCLGKQSCSFLQSTITCSQSNTASMINVSYECINSAQLTDICAGVNPLSDVMYIHSPGYPAPISTGYPTSQTCAVAFTTNANFTLTLLDISLQPRPTFQSCYDRLRIYYGGIQQHEVCGPNVSGLIGDSGSMLKEKTDLRLEFISDAQTNANYRGFIVKVTVNRPKTTTMMPSTVTTTPPTVCKGGQRYSTCGGCTATCDNMFPVCAEVCRVGCFCPPSAPVWLNETCVTRNKCPDMNKPNATTTVVPPSNTTCPGGQQYSTCGSCTATCDNPFPFCTTVCRTGCFCPGSAPIWYNNTCTTIDTCPNTTKPNTTTVVPPSNTTCPGGQQYSTCGSCTGTCDIPFPNCVAVCMTGCFCPRWAPIWYNNTCTTLDKCPNTTKPNTTTVVPPSNTTCYGGQQFTTCGGCTPTCENPDPICAEVCRTGCFCPRSAPYWHNYECVTQDKCPGKTTTRPVPADPCLSNPCLNGGSCEPLMVSGAPMSYSSYICRCPREYFGAWCNQVVPTASGAGVAAVNSCMLLFSFLLMLLMQTFISRE